MDQFVSNFEEACAKLGKGTQIPDVSAWPERLQKHLTALFKLDTILEVNNGDWKADLANTHQYKYYPWFRINPTNDGASGFGLSFSGYDYGYTDTYLGVRLACKDEELAEFMGENCGDLYKELFI